MAGKTTARVKNGVAYFEGESFSLSNADKVKTIDFSGKNIYRYSLSYTRDGNDLKIANYGSTVTIKNFFNEKGSVASTVKTIRVKDNSEKNKYKDYNLATSGLLSYIESGIETFDIKKGVITGTPFADTISAAGFNKPTGKNKDTGVTIKTGNGNDEITGSSYKDTFNITGSGTKTINIGSTDGDDTIKGINTKDINVNLNISGTPNSYERVGNDLKIGTNSTTTTVKDYFKNSTAPNVSLNSNDLVNILNQTELVNIDRQYKLNKDGSVKTDRNSNPIIQTGKQTINGTFLNDVIKGGKGVDTINLGISDYSTGDRVIGGKGDDKITVNGYGNKYIVMNGGDGTDTVNIKNDSASTYLKFNGAGITNNATAKTNLTYEKSGKNDLKITSTIETSAIVTPRGYISNSGFNTDKISYYYACGSANCYTEITDGTGLYSYEIDGETRYATEKYSTKKLNTVKLVTYNYNSIVDCVGFLTDTNYYDSSDYYTKTSLSDSDTLYAYKSKVYSTDYEYVYSTNPVTATKYSDLWLKPDGYGDYSFVTADNKTDDYTAVSSLDKFYLYINGTYSYVTLDKMYDEQEEISKDSYESIYYINSRHAYVVDIDNNSNTPIYKTYNVSDSYYLKNTKGVWSDIGKGIAVSSALTDGSYTKIDHIYKTIDSEGNPVYSINEPEGFEEKIESSSVIIKDYLTKDKYVYINNSNSSSHYYLTSLLNEIGLNMGNANSKKAQTLTGTKFNDNIYGGSGKDKIMTGASDYSRGDVITPGAGNDTITIDGDGYKTINIANKDGNDTIIFTDNNKKTKYDYSTSKPLYLNYEDDADLTYKMKGKDLVITRSYTADGKQTSATTTLKDYFNVDYKYNIKENIIINNSTFYASNYFDNTKIDKSTDKNGKAITKAQKINGNMFNNIITGGSGNDTINGCGGSDTLDGKNGSDTYVVNYKSGSKHYYSDKILISDTGTGAKDIDTLKLDVKKSDMALLFNVSKITNSEDYSDNDIIVGTGDSAKHYSMDDQLIIFANIELVGGVSNNDGNLVSNYGIVADGLEKITTSDKKTVTLNNIKAIAQDVANWLSTANGGAGYNSAAAVFSSENEGDLINMLAQYNPGNAVIKEYMNAG